MTSQRGVRLLLWTRRGGGMVKVTGLTAFTQAGAESFHRPLSPLVMAVDSCIATRV